MRQCLDSVAAIVGGFGLLERSLPKSEILDLNCGVKMAHQGEHLWI